MKGRIKGRSYIKRKKDALVFHACEGKNNYAKNTALVAANVSPILFSQVASARK